MNEKSNFNNKEEINEEEQVEEKGISKSSKSLDEDIFKIAGHEKILKKRSLL